MTQVIGKILHYACNFPTMVGETENASARTKLWRQISCCVSLTNAILSVIACIVAITITPHEELGRIDRINVISQIETDWNQKPFVQIESFEDGCPDAWEPVFEKIWQGIESGCLIDYEYKEKSNKNTVTRRAVSLATDYEMENFERGNSLECI